MCDLFLLFYSIILYLYVYYTCAYFANLYSLLIPGICLYVFIHIYVCVYIQSFQLQTKFMEKKMIYTQIHLQQKAKTKKKFVLTKSIVKFCD